QTRSSQGARHGEKGGCWLPAPRQWLIGEGTGGCAPCLALPSFLPKSHRFPAAGPIGSQAAPGSATIGLPMQSMTPKQIVAELDKYIIGQADAKRAVAVAVRNRWRRQQLPESMRQDVWPKNIIMSGPTGVGKTEIARRLASLTGAPFIKVEATKYAEVGYHGR